MKQLNFAILLTAFLVMNGINAKAHDFVVNGIYYSITSSTDKTVAVTFKGTSSSSYANEYSGSVTIPSSVSYSSTIYSVTSITSDAFSGCSGLTSISVPGSVTSIGQSAFYNCTGLKSVTVGNGVRSIERSAFHMCESLSSISLPSTIESIGVWAFASCKSLESITLPSGLKTLGANAVDDNGNHSYTYNEADEENDASYSYKWYESPFSGCTSLKSFKIASSNTTFMTIDGVLYSKSGKLLYEFPRGKGPSFVMPDGVKYTNDYVFTNCINLTTLTLSDDLQLGYGVFGTNDYLETLNIGKSLTAYQNKNNVGVDNVPSVLSSLTSLSTITVNSQSTALEVYSGALYRIKDDGTKSLLCYPKKRTSPTVEIANNCATIGAGAFMNHYYLQNVVLPEGVQVIERYAFMYCTNLQTVSIPSSLKELGYNAFEGCTSLNKVDIADIKAWCEVEYTFPDSDYDYDSSTGCRANPLYYAHRLCLNGTEVENVTIPDGTKMSGYPFWGCNTLKSVVIGNDISYVGAYAFGQCPNLESVTIGKDVKYIYEGAFYDGNKLTTVTVKAPTPPSLSTWLHPFPYRSQATLYVPVGCKATYEAASNWKGFKEIIEIPASSPTIEFADANVKALCVSYWDTNSNGELDEDEAAAVTSLGERFNGYEIISFDELKYFTGLTTIDARAFQNCSKLKSITLPESLTSIGNSAFARCSSLVSMVVPNGVTSIGNEAFFECGSLTSVTIGSNVETIGDNAFYKCTSMTSMELPGSVKSLGGGAFAYCLSLTSVDIPSSLTNIHYSAFIYCSGLSSLTVEDGNTVYDSRNNYNAIIETATNTLAHGCMNTVIPNDVTAIGHSAFYGCSGLTSIAIPHTVASIGDFAFSGCDNLSSVTVERTTPVKIVSYTFSNSNNATLYVPYGCKAAYEAADYWKDFKEIVEMQPELTEKEVLSVEALEAKRGKTVEMAINLTNESEDLTAFQFDITLPAGITLAKAENGKYLVSKTERFADDDQQLNVSLVTGNTYRVVCFSMNKDVITGNEGALLNVVLQVSENMEAGLYEGRIENIVFTKTDGTQEKLNDAAFSLEVIAYVTGDANGDGEVNVTDIVEIVNAIMEQPSERFIAEAADVNGDGEVNVTDIVLVVSMIMNDESSASRRTGGSPVKSGSRYIAAQFDVMLADGQLPTDIILNGYRQSGHSTVYERTGRNTWRVVVYSLGNEHFLGNDSEQVSINVNGNESVVAIENILFVTDGFIENRFPSIYGNATGIDDLQFTDSRYDCPVYDLQGRKVTNKRKGPYIVNGKKALVK